MSYDNDVQGDCEYVLARSKQVSANQSFSVTTKNVPCGDAGVTCTKAVTITASSVKIKLILGAPPSVNDVGVDNGVMYFPGGQIDVNDMFQYVKLNSGVEVLYDLGTNGMVILNYSSSTL